MFFVRHLSTGLRCNELFCFTVDPKTTRKEHMETCKAKLKNNKETCEGNVNKQKKKFSNPDKVF